MYCVVYVCMEQSRLGVLVVCVNREREASVLIPCRQKRAVLLYLQSLYVQAFLHTAWVIQGKFFHQVVQTM